MGKPWARCCIRLLLLSVCVLSVNAAAAVLSEKSSAKKRYSISVPAMNAVAAFDVLAEQTQAEFIFPYDIASSRVTKAVHGRYTLMDALRLMLRNTGLSSGLSENGAIRIYLSKGADNDHEGIEMMNTKKNVLAATVGMFLAGGSLAEEVGSGQDGELGWLLEEVVVTATKRAQSVHDVPMSVSALTGEDLTAQGVADLQSLSFAVPGLLVAESGTFQRRISIRGVGNTFGGSSLVGMYIDESSVASLPSNQVDLRVHDLERVEVLKGPQGTLYGEGSVGGTIRYITKDPQLDGFEGSMSVDGSSTMDGGTSQEYRSVLNVPLSETVGLRFVGQYIDSAGWVDQPALDKGDANGYELFNIRSKLLWQPSDNLEVKASTIVHRNDGGVQSAGEDKNGNYPQAFNLPSSSEDNYDQFNVTVQYDAGDVTYVSSSSYLDTDKRALNWMMRCCVATETVDELVVLKFGDYRVSAEIFTQEFRVSSNGTGPWHWTSGLFYKDADTIPFDIRDYIFGSPPAFSFVGEDNSTSWAVFGETSYQLTDKLEIGVGLRYFEDDREFFPFPTALAEKKTFDSTNPKAFLSYHVSEDAHFYANVAKGFRSGGFNSDTSSYDPENVWSYELGSKANFLDSRLKTELAIFFSDYEDYQIIGVPPGEVANITSNAGNAEIQGVEVSLQYFASEHLELGFTGSYLDTKFTEINSTGSSHAVGDPLDMAARYGYNFWMNYSFSWFDDSSGFLRMDYSQQGKSNYRNRSFDNPSAGLVYHSTSDVIEMFNARLGWEGNAWSVELYALNLLNDRGLVGPIGLEWVSPRNRPRTIGINLGFNF